MAYKGTFSRIYEEGGTMLDNRRRPHALQKGLNGGTLHALLENGKRTHDLQKWHLFSDNLKEFKGHLNFSKPNNK